jgi:hypothetical protein
VVGSWKLPDSAAVIARPAAVNHALYSSSNEDDEPCLRSSSLLVAGLLVWTGKHPYGHSHVT